MAVLTTPQVMQRVLLALLPGLLALMAFYGAAYLPRLAFAIALGLAVEAIALALQRRPVRATVSDGSTALTCTLLTLALPPVSGLLVLAVAVVAAVGLGKHLYGGLGGNPFNPAVVGYAVALVSFPEALAAWPMPTDGTTAATALSGLRYREGLTIAEAWTPEAGFGAIGGYGWEWINAAFLAGGLALVALRLAAWRVPAALLGTLALLAALSYDQGGSGSLGSPLFHLFSGGTMLAAFFFATDPVTHPATARGQILFGCLVGAVTFAVRAVGAYPDGLAFGILLGNAATPWLDRALVRRDA
ncbi:MAG: RnfABCDGE type electron transport complex subunit D [Pseudomonadales bacterium]